MREQMTGRSRGGKENHGRECVTYGEVLGESLKCTGIFRMFENVSSRVPPLNGVVAYCARGKISFPPARLNRLY